MKAFLILSAILAGSCTTVPAGPPRARTALPEELAKRFEKPGGTLQVEILESRTLDGCMQWKGLIQENGAQIPFEYFRPKQGQNLAFVLVLPYLEGSYFFPRLVCKNLARNGIASAFLERPGNVLAPGQTAAELDQIFTKGVIRYRHFLDWIAQREEIDSSRMGLVGMSMGSFVGTVLMATDARISRAVLALPGCDVASLLTTSSEKKIKVYMRSRQEKERLRPEEIVEDFRRNFSSDPSRFAEFLASEGLLVISARYDGVIPREFSDRIWRQLGEPERIWLPTGHGTSGFCLPYLQHKILRHFQSAWKEQSLLTRLAE